MMHNSIPGLPIHEDDNHFCNILALTRTCRSPKRFYQYNSFVFRVQYMFQILFIRPMKYTQCLKLRVLWKLFANTHCKKHNHGVGVSLPRSHGATHSLLSLALFRMVSGSGREWRTMAPYSPYSAMMVLRPQHFSVFRHFARRFWNQTYTHNETVL